MSFEIKTIEVFDKSEQSTITDNEIKRLMQLAKEI